MDAVQSWDDLKGNAFDTLTYCRENKVISDVMEAFLIRCRGEDESWLMRNFLTFVCFTESMNTVAYDDMFVHGVVQTDFVMDKMARTCRMNNYSKEELVRVMRLTGCEHESVVFSLLYKLVKDGQLSIDSILVQSQSWKMWLKLLVLTGRFGESDVCKSMLGKDIYVEEDEGGNNRFKYEYGWLMMEGESADDVEAYNDDVMRRRLNNRGVMRTYRGSCLSFFNVLVECDAWDMLTNFVGMMLDDGYVLEWEKKMDVLWILSQSCDHVWHMQSFWKMVMEKLGKEDQHEFLVRSFLKGMGGSMFFTEWAMVVDEADLLMFGEMIDLDARPVDIRFANDLPCMVECLIDRGMVRGEEVVTKYFNAMVSACRGLVVKGKHSHVVRNVLLKLKGLHEELEVEDRYTTKLLCGVEF